MLIGRAIIMKCISNSIMSPLFQVSSVAQLSGGTDMELLISLVHFEGQEWMIFTTLDVYF